MPKKKKSASDYIDETYIGIDGELGVETNEQKKERTYRLLNYTRGARKGKDSMITVRVSGVEVSQTHVNAICFYEGYKIVIPDKEFTDFPEYNPKKHPYNSELHMREIMMRACIGAEIDFCAMPKQKIGGKVVDTINKEDMFAICSRKHAMRKRYEKMWLKQKDGSRRITEGRAIAARVVSVSNTTAYFESNGVEFSIPHKELSWSRIGNVKTMLHSGQRVIVRLLSVEYAEDELKEKPKVRASLKQMQEDPNKKFCEMMNEKEVYRGKVTSIWNSFFFVQCDNGADILCGTSKSLPRYPYRDDIVEIRIMQIDYDRSRMFGKIINVIDSDNDWK